MQQKPRRGAPRKAPSQQFTEHTAVMLRPCDRARLERLAGGEPLSAYIRRVLREHVAQHLNLQQGG